MAVNFDGVSEYLSGSASRISSFPFTISAWIQVTTPVSIAAVASFGESGVSDNFAVLETRTTNRFRGFLSANGGSSTINNGTNNEISNDTWHNIVIVVVNADTVHLVLDGTDDTSVNSTGSLITPEDFDETVIGSRSRSTKINFWAGDIAEVGIWDRQTTAAEETDLSNKKSPLFFPQGLKEYYPLGGKYGDNYNSHVSGGTNLSATGTPTFVTHVPDMIYPASTIFHPF